MLSGHDLRWSQVDIILNHLTSGVFKGGMVMLRKWFLVLTVTAIAIGFSVSPALSGWHRWEKKVYKKHFRHNYERRQQAVLPMFPVDETGQWTLTRGAPKGKMTYFMWGETFDFAFKGVNLLPDISYTLIAIEPDGQADHILGDGEINRRGKLYLKGSEDICVPMDVRSAEGVRIQLIEKYGGENERIVLDGFHPIRFFNTDTVGCGSAGTLQGLEEEQGDAGETTQEVDQGSEDAGGTVPDGLQPGETVPDGLQLT